MAIRAWRLLGSMFYCQEIPCQGNPSQLPDFNTGLLRKSDVLTRYGLCFFEFYQPPVPPVDPGMLNAITNRIKIVGIEFIKPIGIYLYKV